MSRAYTDEATPKSLIEAAMRPVDPSATIWPLKRTAHPTGLTWTVTFAVRVPKEMGFEAAMSLRALTVESETALKFAGSDSGIVEGDYEHDYLLISAEIRPKL